MNQIKYHGDMATIEILLPKYLANWIEGQAKKERVSAGSLVRSWISKMYEMAAHKASK